MCGAPFSFPVGCVTPRYGSQVAVIGETASSVVLRLKRRANDMVTGETAIPRADTLGLSSIEETATRTLELTMAGSAASEARWSIEQASLPSWLDTPLAGSLAANETTARWEISVSTDGLAGLDTPYTTTLNVFIDADKDLVIAVPVYLFVSSEEGLRPCPPEEMFAQGVCTPCLEQGTCALDTLLEDVNITAGHWRLSNRSQKTVQCRADEGRGWSPCQGGVQAGTLGDGYCAANHLGARCESCIGDHYFKRVKAECVACPPEQESLGLPLGVLSGLLLTFAVFAACYNRLLRRCCGQGKVGPGPNADSGGLKWLRSWLVRWSGALGLIATCKVLVGFLQVVAYMPTTYGVELPPSYADIWDTMLDVANLLSYAFATAPWPCIGGFKTELISWGFAPLGLIAAVLLAGFVWNAIALFISRGREGKSLLQGLITGVPAAILVALFCAPAVSSKAFAAFNCRAYDDDTAAGSSKSFLLAAPGTLCWESDEHAEMVSIAVVLIVLWPLGFTLAVAVLLFRCREAIEMQTPTPLSRAIAMLHREYRPHFFYYELVILIQRTSLAGLLLLLPDDQPFLRLQLAILLSTAYLLLGAWAKPFRRPIHNYLYCLICFAYVVIFMSGLGVYLIQEIEEYSSEKTVEVVIGVTSGDGFISIVLAFAVVVLLVAASMTSHQIRVERRRASRDAAQRRAAEAMRGRLNAPPTATWALREDQQYCCFISHFKKEAACDARYLSDLIRRMLGVEAFLVSVPAQPAHSLHSLHGTRLLSVEHTLLRPQCRQRRCLLRCVQDSSNLDDLRRLFTDGVHKSCTLVLLATEGVLTRPWCLLELWEAHRLKIPVIVMPVAGKKYEPDEARALLQNLEERLPAEALGMVTQHLDAEGSMHDLPGFKAALVEVLGLDSIPPPPPPTNEKHSLRRASSSNVSMAQLIRERSSPGLKGRASKGVKKEQVGASLGWQPWADDSHVVANAQDLLNCCAAATGRTLEWHDPLATPAATAEAAAGSGRFRQRVIVKAMDVVKKAMDKLASLMDTDSKEPKVVIVADLDEAASEARLLQAAARRARLGSEFVLANEDAHVREVELDHLRLVTGDL